MDYANPYAYDTGAIAASASVAERSAFIRRTYTHLVGAVIAFLMIEAVLLTLFPPAVLLPRMGALLGGFGWLAVLGAFMVVSWVANSWAHRETSPAMQYAGLGLYVVAEAVIFLPLMAISLMVDETGSIPLQAGLITGIVFMGLTAFVFATGADFSWLGRYLWLAAIAGMAMIVVGIFTGFTFGLFLSAAFVVLAAGYILYDTSNVIHHYRTTQHVAASLALFASVALMLWYVMQILISLSGDD